MERPTQTASRGLETRPLQNGTVTVLTGPQQGLTLKVTEAPLVIGASSGSGLALTDAKVSRQHCEVRLAHAAFAVKDLNSRNGTWFEGSKLHDAVVPRGAMLRLGDTTLVLRASDPSVPTLGPVRESLGGLVGKSPAMQRLYTELEVAAKSDAAVLLLGETGTGKGVAAAELHRLSGRPGRFEAFDCASVVPSLASAELFGVVKGAFTDAHANRSGAFERAHRGTLFLDELGELPLEAQAKLLRACESKTVTPVGGEAPVACDARLVAATCRDLAHAVVAGAFRQDLFYRLEVFHLVVPPLRSRLGDLPLLVEHLMRQLGCTAIGEVTGPNLAVLEHAAWPGNVRELRNVIERAVARGGKSTPFTKLSVELSAQPTLSATETASGPAGFSELKRDLVERFERSYFERLLEQTQGNVRLAAREAGLERTQLKRLLRKHGLLKPSAAESDSEDEGGHH